MASIRKLPSGKWNVRITRKGYPLQTKSFTTRSDADKWARTIESEMDRGCFVCRSEAEATTLAQALERYRREVTPKKKGASREADRIGVWLRSDLAARSLASLRSSDFAAYRDKRLGAGLASNTVRLELAIVSHLFTIAAQEWGIAVTNPIQSIRKPKGSNARSRRLEGDEEQRLLAACAGHPYLSRLIVLALETACRQSEIVFLTWSEIDLTWSVIKKDTAKNGEGRIIPLTKKALSVLPPKGIGRLFPVFPRKAWETALKKAGMVNFHFHDLRHEAITRMFERGMNQFEVAAVSGHKTMQMLSRYTHLKPADLLRKMEAGI
ncbi:MAG: site-specific integrase [Thiobacillus sp.]|nr:site-specific integrase [Thiobacillus sp.]